MSQAKSPPLMRNFMPSVLQLSMRLHVTIAWTSSYSQTRWLLPVELLILLSTPDRAILWLSVRLFRLGSPTRMASQLPS
ncbi:hypothetical protein CVT25_008908, partial [Psilocybe cyanescens]